jgi:hypothetical protein
VRGIRGFVRLRPEGSTTRVLLCTTPTKLRLYSVYSGCTPLVLRVFIVLRSTPAVLYSGYSDRTPGTPTVVLLYSACTPLVLCCTPAWGLPESRVPLATAAEPLAVLHPVLVYSGCSPDVLCVCTPVVLRLYSDVLQQYSEHSDCTSGTPDVLQVLCCTPGTPRSLELLCSPKTRVVDPSLRPNHKGIHKI